MHRFTIAADEIMPVGQGLALRAQAIGAGLRQPFEVVDLRLGQRQAIGDLAAALLVISPARGRTVEQEASHIGWIDSPRVPVFQLFPAAFSPAVTPGPTFPS